MTIQSKLDQAMINSPVIMIDDRFKGLFVSDLHMGVGDEADDFKPNSNLFLDVLKRYLSKGYRIFILGDAYELWENSNLEDIEKTYPEVCDLLVRATDRIKGNHDQQLILPDSYVLFNKKVGKKILLIHGHQGDFFNDEAYPLGWFFTKYIWGNLQLIGFKDPTTAVKDKNSKKHELTRETFHEWAFSRKQTVLFGHTHFSESDPPYYWNCGSWIDEGGKAVVIEGDQISLQTFK
jgi:UDP-2,3-diacylglucosamine pyrophosphatase LpxH